MKNPILMLTLLSTLGLAACDRSPTVVTVPTPVAVPGATGKPGEGTTVIVMPAASGPAR